MFEFGHTLKKVYAVLSWAGVREIVFFFKDRTLKVFVKILQFFHVCKTFLLKNFYYFLLFHSLMLRLDSGSASRSVFRSAFVFKTLDPDPHEMDADPKPF